MKHKKISLIAGLVTILALVFTAAVLAQAGRQSDSQDGLVEVVRESASQYQNVATAEAAGYGLFHGCVSSPTEGAMGVHLVNGDLVADGTLDATNPEAILYEMKNGRMRLLGVEYVVIADDWHDTHETPPVLMGQVLNYVSSPNRYGIPAFYELHVWVWKHNPLGTFADFNPLVSCVEYTHGR